MDCIDVLEFIKQEHTVCEVGCRTGLSTKLFLETGATVYTIDPWEPYDGWDNVYYSKVLSQEQLMNEFYKTAMERLAPFKDKITVLRMKSSEGVNHIPMCDLIWIDGNHEYNFVLKDLELYWDKVKDGGYLSGDDYHQESCPGVKEAVNDFVESRGLNMDVIGRSFIIKKEYEEIYGMSASQETHMNEEIYGMSASQETHMK